MENKKSPIRSSVEIKRFSPFLRQAFVTSGVALNIVGHGCVIGFPAVLLPQLEHEDSYIKVNHHSASWIASIIGIALLIGNTISPFLMQRYGRRIAHKITIVPITIGWFMVLFSKNVTTIIVARLLQGISIGMTAPLGSIIIGESVSPKNRGFFLGAISLSLAAGILLSHIIGTYLVWTYTALVCASFSFSAFLIILFSPETPSWLAAKGRYDECRKSFYWLRGYGLIEINELEVMISSISADSKAAQEKKDKEDKNHQIRNKFRNTAEVFGKKEFYKPVIIMIHLYVMFQFSGNNAFASYAIKILKSLFGEDVDIYLAMILLDCVRLVVGALSCVIVRKLKRRTVILGSGCLCILSLLAMSAYLYIKTNDIVKDMPTWIPILLFATYMFSLSIGILPIPFTIAGEIFPIAYKSLGAGISVLFLSSMFFAVVKSFPYMLVDIHLYGVFISYAVIVLYCLIVVVILLPETKDKTLIEIESHFKGIKLTSVDQVDPDLLEKASFTEIPSHRYSRRLSSSIY